MRPETTICRGCPLRTKGLFDPFSEAELAFMERFKRGEIEVAPGRPILREDESSDHFFTCLAGQGLRYKAMEDGGRQVLNFVFPGDLIGLQAAVMDRMQHTVVASSPMLLCVFSRAALWDLFRRQPERGFSLTWLAAIEEQFLGETVATLGQRDAVQRVAWALVRVHERLAALGLVENGTVPFPHRQQDLADALGLSLVHTNKTLARLRAAGLADWRGGRLALAGRQRLAEIAMIDLARPPRRPLL